MTKVKKNYRNLVHGDVLAYKIANEDEILNGRYFIYIRYNPKEWKDYPIINKKTSYKHNQVFAVAITKDCNIPKIENILDNVDYLPLEEYYFETDTVEIVYGLKYKNLIPDEYGLFYCCLKYLTFETKEDRELKSVFYIGNIPDYKPKNLFIEEIYHASLYDSAINSIENKLLDVYKEKIIKKSEYYNEEYLVYLKKKYYFKVIANQNKLRKSTLEIPMYCYGHGADIYDNEVALNVQKIFEIVYDDQLKYVDIMNDLWIHVFDYVFDDNDFFIAYMVLADQFLKRKRIDNNLKKLAISVIKDDLKYNWEGREDYKKRAYFENKLLCNLIDFEPNEDTDYIFKNKSDII